MTLAEQLREDKLTLIAMNSLIQETAESLSLSLEGRLSAQCAQAEVNRSQVYEKKARLQQVFETLELPSVGRPANNRGWVLFQEREKEWALKEAALRYRLDHPEALILHKGGYQNYSPGFKRFLLDCADQWEGSIEIFCQLVEVPYPTFAVWQRDDEDISPLKAAKPAHQLPQSASEDCRRIVEDYERWEGSLRDFLGFEAARMNLPPSQIRRVLVIAGMLPVKPKKPPRYRGSTETISPGAILITDGKEVKTVFTASGEVRKYNWQAMVDQATVCHTGAVITKTECAQGILKAFEASCQLLGRKPMALLHDNKSVYEQKGLKMAIEPATDMIAATPNRPENKAAIEGEFGKFEQTVGKLCFDDGNLEALRRSAVSEVIRAYTAALNHAGRTQFDGKSRLQVLRETCRDPETDRKFIESLKANHQNKRRGEALKTQPITRRILDKGLAEFDLLSADPKGKTRHWLSSRYSPEAVRQALSIFATAREKKSLRNKTALRYLVKVIQNCQHEVDLRDQEEYLRRYAQEERQAWLEELEAEYRLLEEENRREDIGQKEFAFQLSENAVFGGLILQRAFWEDKLKSCLQKNCELFQTICLHVRRLFEADWNDRFQLISRLISWEMELAR